MFFSTYLGIVLLPANSHKVYDSMGLENLIMKKTKKYTLAVSQSKCKHKIILLDMLDR